MSKRIYTVEVYGENNTFTIEATACYEPYEDWLTGKVTYQPYVDKAWLVHGNRRRDVTDLLTEEQEKQIIDKINQINLTERENDLIDRAEAAREARCYDIIDCPNMGVSL